jgi:hypothetical protein
MEAAAAVSASQSCERASSGQARTASRWPLLLVAALCLAALGWQLWFGLDPADEGFLWYGAQRTVLGELPLRDFQAYDPGRYFWSAAWMLLVGDSGIVALRAGNVVLAAITVVLATWPVTSASAHRHPLSAIAIGAIFTLWMVPGFKVADSFAVILLLFGLTRLIRRPTPGRYLAGGICWGIAATIGINHALYGLVAGLLTLAYLRGAPQLGRTVAFAAAGAAIGYSPMLALHAFAPEFTAAFIDGIMLLFEYGATNQSLPFPSPLAFLQVEKMGYLIAATETVAALLFLAVPLFWAGMAWRLRGRASRAAVPAPVLAGLFLSLPYAHYAYSRADPLHLAISILPVLAAALAWGIEAPRGRWVLLSTAFACSLIVTAHMHPGYYFLRGFLTEPVAVGGDRLLLRPQVAAQVRAVQKVAGAAASAQFFAGPYLPAAYAIAARRSPLWEIYMLFPSSPARQRAEIGRLEAAGVRHAMILAARADGRADLGLAQTHPLLFAYLRKCLPRAERLPLEPPLIVLSADGGQCQQGPVPGFGGRGD